ncbi:sulfurtransferase [Shouchella tritolerans]|uniref:sulfurtransferase n=1 Tax=Shouchella tritolerans TaxID=2979466 RepID=UPI0021E81FF5|nr:sulfurtransferase [Shouchella tritolerans]
MIVTPKWLYDRLGEVIVLDARFDLFDEKKGKQAYRAEHLPGALFIDMVEEMADKRIQGAGRHPLPTPEDMARMFARKGISKDSKVVIYDDQNGGIAAARAWWMLEFLGNNNAAILDGGIQAWKNSGYPTTDEVKLPQETEFEPHVKEDWLVSAEQVKNKLGSAVLIDSRSRERYQGEQEPLDLKAGHIPGALNYPWGGVLRQDGNWKSTEELVQHFAALPRDQEVIVYCGSGISACPNVLALKRAGFKQVTLYAGSWSDWSSRSGYPVETGHPSQ